MEDFLRVQCASEAFAWEWASGSQNPAKKDAHRKNVKIGCLERRNMAKPPLWVWP